MTRTFKPETVGEFTALRGNLAATYLSLVGILRTLEAQQNTTTAQRRASFRAALAAVDVEPLTNPADQRW